MCFELRLALCFLTFMAAACSPGRRIGDIRSGEVKVALSVSEDGPGEEEDKTAVIDSIRGTLSDGPIIMNAIRDSETGEMVATDVIRASKVTARFRNVAERAGYVTIGFDVTVPAGMALSQWQLKIRPLLVMQQDTVTLDPVYVTGERYRAAQLRGYEKYRQFLNSIVADDSCFVNIGLLEIFIERNFPRIYAMKADSSYIDDFAAESLFGVTQREAAEHYTNHLKQRANERRKGRVGEMYERYVKDPIVQKGVRLDTVLSSGAGDFVYRYTHTFRSRPRLKKVTVALDGSLYERGMEILRLPFPDDLTFYISSLSALADDTERYRMIVKERRIYDNTKAFIDFGQGRADVDTTLGDNASELRRVRRCIDDVVAKSEFELDSLVIVASCSPEGRFDVNQRLSEARSETVCRYISDFVPEQWRDSLKTSRLPENWGQLALLVENDTLLDSSVKRRIAGIVAGMSSPDEAEERLAVMPEYRYLREKLYPQLRCVSFDFYLHRVGMVKDTVHTTEIDTVYMAGLKALRELDYKQAVSFLRSYRDYNAALAFVSADYNHSALDVLGELDDKDAKVCYLKAMVLERLGLRDEAMRYFMLSISYDSRMEHRANLDPEMCGLVRQRSKTIKSEGYE